MTRNEMIQMAETMEGFFGVEAQQQKQARRHETIERIEWHRIGDGTLVTIPEDDDTEVK